MKLASETSLWPRGHTKAFKGKADLRRRLRDVEQQLRVLNRGMRQLKDQTRQVRGRFALETCVKHRRESLSLRWRYRLGWNATWERDVEPALAMFPVELQRWYRQVNGTAAIMNVRERCLRYERAALTKLLAQLREQPGNRDT